MFQYDWRNTPNSRRNQYMADRWFSIEQRSPKKRGKLAWFSQPMISFFGVTWLRWQIFKEKALLQHFPFYTTCSWAIFLRTRHLARNAIFFPFPLSKMPAAESWSIVQIFILFNVVNNNVWPICPFRALYKINAFILSERHNYDPPSSF